MSVAWLLAGCASDAGIEPAQSGPTQSGPTGPLSIRIVGPPTAPIGARFDMRIAAFDAWGTNVPAPTVAWTSSDTLVASVHTTFGVVTALRVGTTTIHARAGSLVSTHDLTIHPPPPGSLSLSLLPVGEFGDTIQLSPGQSVRLTSYAYLTQDPHAIVTPTGTVAWTSSRPDLVMAGDSGVITAIAEGTAQVNASVDGLLGTKAIKVATTTGATTVRFVHAAWGYGRATFRPNTGTPVPLSLGESHESIVPAGTFQLTSDIPPSGAKYFQPHWIDTQQFLGFLPAQTHSTFVMIANLQPGSLDYFGVPTFVPLWDWTAAVPSDSAVVRVVLATTGGYNVYFVDHGAPIGVVFLQGCYLDWPYGVSKYATRATGTFDIVLQEGKGFGGPEVNRIPVTAAGGHAYTYIVIGGSPTAVQVIALVDR